MPRGTPLATLRQMLKAEVGDFTGANTARDQEYNQLLNNMQIRLATENSWSFLNGKEWLVDVAPGQRFVSLPTLTAGTPSREFVAIDFDRNVLVEVYYNQIYQRVDHGIGSDEYNTLDPLRGETSDPIQRWQIRSNTTELDKPNQFEVWPVPVTQQQIKFTGSRVVLPLLGDNDSADLDDLLLVLFVASEKLSRSKQQDANLKMQAATRRLTFLRQGGITKEVVRNMAGNNGNQDNKKMHLTGAQVLIVK